MKKEKRIIFLSNGVGGISTFQSNFINFLLRKELKIIFFDKKNNETFKNIKNPKKIEFIKSDVLWDLFGTLKKLKKIDSDQYDNYIIFSNPSIFSIYYFFIKFLIKRSKIVLFFHSHITNKKFIIKISCFTTSLLSIFIHKKIFVSKFTQKWWHKKFFLTRYSNQEIIYNHLRIPKIKHRNKDSNLKIGFVGRISPEKGFNTFMKIAKNIKNKNIYFYIFGNNSIKKSYVRNNFKIYSWKKKSFIYKSKKFLFTNSGIR